MKRLFTSLVYVFAAIGFILVAGYIALALGFTKTSGIIDTQHDYFQNQVRTEAWATSEEWLVLKEAIPKDVVAIRKASAVTGVPARRILAPLVVEQLRLFNSEREVFKQIFAPLKILGNQSQFSWGVMGIKQDTARAIELHLKDPSSPYYLGPNYEHLLDFTTDKPDTERFARLTNEKDRYYSYLYGALMIKQLETQWEKAGFAIADKPGIVATLFNIGFDNSHPHADAELGGAEIDINKTTYSFGGLAQSFYDSKELLQDFPLPVSK